MVPVFGPAPTYIGVTVMNIEGNWIIQENGAKVRINLVATLDHDDKEVYSVTNTDHNWHALWLALSPLGRMTGTFMGNGVSGQHEITPLSQTCLAVWGKNHNISGEFAYILQKVGDKS